MSSEIKFIENTKVYNRFNAKGYKFNVNRFLRYCHKLIIHQRQIFLMKAQLTVKLYFVNHVRARAKSSLQYFIWLKLKTVKAYSVVKSVNFTYGYEYINRARKC